MNLKYLFGVVLILILVIPSVSAVTYTPVYPVAFTNTYVNVSTSLGSGYAGWRATDPGLSLIGGSLNNEWVSDGISVNQRLNIDLGPGNESAIIRVYYENRHNSGANTDGGIKNFTIQGSNSAASFVNPNYIDGTGWTNLTASKASMDQHVAANTADPKYFTVTNIVPYRYYSIRAENTWGGVGTYMGLRRIELQKDANTTVSASPDTSTNVHQIYATNVSFSVFPTTTSGQNFSFGDGYYSQQKNTVPHFYAVAGLYNISWNSTIGQTATTTFNQTSDYDTNVHSWMHLDGAAGGVLFADIIGNAWTPTSVTTETAVAKFGTASALFNADGDRLQTPSSSNFNFGTGNFTIEQWVYPTSSAADRYIISRSTNIGATGWGIYHSTGSAASDGWVVYLGSTALQTGTFTIPLNQWNYVVVQRINGVVNVSVNGVYQTGVTAAGNYDTVAPVVYGDPITGGKSSRMYLDETRISTAARWLAGGERYDPPYAAYRGDLFAVADPNPDSTLRFKTNPTATPPGNVIIANLTPRYRTVQIQNVSIANNISTTLLFSKDHVFASRIVANTTTFSGINFTYAHIDNANGIVTINATRPGGFSTNGSLDSRASFADVEMVYVNYTEPEEDPFWDDDDLENRQFFGSGYLKNTTTGQDYGVNHFLATNVSFADWITFSNFTVSTKTPYVGLNTVQFIPELNFTANRFDWDYGDGVTETTTNGLGRHIYTSPGLKNVRLTAYLWQNNSVSNATTIMSAVNVSYDASYVKADFSCAPTAGSSGLLVTCTDMSIFGSTSYGKTYNWSFGDVGFSLTPFSSSTASTVTHVYSNTGTYTVILTVNNTVQTNTSMRENYIIISNTQQTTWYVPAQVTFRLFDQNGQALENVYMTATPLNFTAPSDWTQILIGIQPTVNITGTTVSGFSAGDGSTTFPMVPSLLYELHFTSPSKGINFTTSVHPSQYEYIYTIPVGFTTIPTSAANVITYSLQNVTISSTEEFANMSYYDASGGTTILTFAVYNTSNVLVYSQTYNGVAANSQAYSQMFVHGPGETFTYGIFASQSQYGWINQTDTVTFGRSIALLGSAPSWIEQWLAIGLLVLLAGVFSIFSIRFALVAIPLLAWYFQMIGWYSIGLGGDITYGILFCIGVISYIRWREEAIN